MKAVKKKVLVVDDSADILNVLAVIFRFRGCATYLAANGREAIKQALEHSPDLILMDIRMPVMDGFETTRRIHDIPYLSKVPVIAMSAHFDRQWSTRALDAGCVECVAKPLELDKIDLLVSRYIHVGRKATTSQRAT